MSDVRTLLASTLPDLAKQSDFGRLVEGVTALMGVDYHDAYETLGIVKDLADTVTSGGLDLSPIAPDAQYYMVEATHKRLEGAGAHEFKGIVPMARFPLPLTHERVLNTRIGYFLDGDHFLHNRELFEEYYGSVLDYDIAKIELIAPMRVGGYRFGAIAVYLVWNAQDSAHPWGYVFEAGMANGKPRVLYAALNGGVLRGRRAGYTPTPFSDKRNYYSGSLRWDDTGGLEGFGIQISTMRHVPPHFELIAQFHPTEAPDKRDPRAMVLEAALRVCAIADARGEEVDGLGFLTPLLAGIAREKYDWVKKPGVADAQ